MLSNIVVAQYTKETTISVLTNNGSRRWQLDSIKTLGGCLNETLVVVFNQDKTAEFQYCNKGQWEKQKVRWALTPGKQTKSWIIDFLGDLQYNHDGEVINFKRNYLKLFSRDLKTRGNKLLLSYIQEDSDPANHIKGIFYSKD